MPLWPMLTTLYSTSLHSVCLWRVHRIMQRHCVCLSFSKKLLQKVFWGNSFLKKGFYSVSMKVLPLTKHKQIFKTTIIIQIRFILAENPFSGKKKIPKLSKQLLKHISLHIFGDKSMIYQSSMTLKFHSSSNFEHFNTKIITIKLTISIAVI